MDETVQEEKKIEGKVSTLISEDRILNFSDAIFAFAATLLVLKIDLPQVTSDQLASFDTFASLWPQYYANLISFLIIGYYWLNHHAIFGMIKKFNVTIVWMNLFFLLFISFIPFPVDLFGDFPTTPSVVVFYSASLAIVGYLLTFLWWYASSHHRLVSSTFSDKQIRYYLMRNLIAPVVFTLSIPLIILDPILAQVSWLFVLIGILVVNKAFHLKGLSTIEKLSL